jgi:uncharacterized 2Fe-2S/4Fe-4S cluster protein (DUF4445 family)
MECKVDFLPTGKSIKVPEGTLILDAAAMAGVSIEAPCGGQGRCGRCLVKVEAGEVSNYENPYLTSEQLQQGWVLSCTAKVAGDVIISVPAKGQRDEVVSKSPASKEVAAAHLDWSLSPAVRHFFVELPPPTLGDNTADFNRLKSVMAAQCGIEHLSTNLALMQKLSQNLRRGNWQVTCAVDVRDRDREAQLIDVYPSCKRQLPLGIALDIGTTNVVADLVDLNSGSIINRVSAVNKQISCGEDVISRIIYSERRGGLKRLHQLIIQTINGLLSELAIKCNIKASDIERMVVAGNTTMIHLFLSLPPKYIRREPYISTVIQFPLVTARELGVKINPNAFIYCIPAVGAYIGGDITAGVLSSRLFKSDRLSLFLDIGTNGEIVLGNSDWMMSCACSAGPAFEGAGVSCGMPAARGAIEEVTINSKTLEPTIKVIGDIPPLGICGSGMISALAEVLVTGIVDKAGHINRELEDESHIRLGEHGAEIILCRAADSGTGEDIILNGVDINNLIRAKAAIYAGIVVMVKKLGIPLSQIEQALIGGGFGQHVNIERGIQIGLLPDLPWERFQFLGNTSASGAYRVLLSEQAQRRAEDIACEITYLDLVADDSFMNELAAALFLPHTDSANFPSLSKYHHGRGDS